MMELLKTDYDAYYVGVDPGMSGAVCVLNGLAECEFIKNDSTETDIANFIAGWATHNTFAVIERVNAMPKQGVSSTFKFGKSYGFLRGCLIAKSVPFEEYTPVVWQRYMGCLSKGDKNVTKARAQQLFPKVKITHAIADALLIAEFCRRVRTGTLNTRKP
jgi:crossover junction endodeoxyribonuclease RuvC